MTNAQRKTYTDRLSSAYLEGIGGTPDPQSRHYAAQLAFRFLTGLEAAELTCRQCDFPKLVETAATSLTAAPYLWATPFDKNPDHAARTFATKIHRHHRRPSDAVKRIQKAVVEIIDRCLTPEERLLRSASEDVLLALAKTWRRPVEALRRYKRKLERTLESLERRLVEAYLTHGTLPKPAFRISLIESFTVDRPSAGNPKELSLTVRVPYDAPLIWFNDDKLELQRDYRELFGSRLSEAQEMVDSFLRDEEPARLKYENGVLSVRPRGDRGPGTRRIPLRVNGRLLPMRWASGGAVIVLEHRGKAYFWTAYRNIDPVGLNITTGASETAEEQSNLDLLIGREVPEEFLVVRECRNAGARVSRVGLDLSVRIDHTSDLHRKALDQAYGEGRWKWKEGTLDLTRLPGPHAVKVEYQHLNRSVNTDRNGVVLRKNRGVYITVNLPELGFEVVRFYYLSLPPRGQVRLRDGELTGLDDGERIARPIYLLPVEELFRCWVANDNRMPSELDDRVWASVIEDHGDIVNDPLLVKDPAYRELWSTTKRRLCPATRQVLDLFFASEGYSQLSRARRP